MLPDWKDLLPCLCSGSEQTHLGCSDVFGTQRVFVCRVSVSGKTVSRGNTKVSGLGDELHGAAALLATGCRSLCLSSSLFDFKKMTLFPSYKFSHKKLSGGGGQSVCSFKSTSDVTGEIKPAIWLCSFFREVVQAGEDRPQT